MPDQPSEFRVDRALAGMHFQKPAWIKEFRAWVSETLINKGLVGRRPEMP